MLLRHNSLIIGCLGATLLATPGGRAALADTPAAPAPAPTHSDSHSGPSSPHTDSHSGSSAGHSDSHSAPAPSGTGAHTDAGKSSGTAGTPSSSSSSHAALPSSNAPPASHALPDYGGRDGIAGTTNAAQSTPALNPLAQAWRAFEALAIVLALIIGGLYLLQRYGLIKPDGGTSVPTPLLAALPGFLKTATQGKGTALPPAPPPGSEASWITMIGSQALPNAQGASLHLVSLGGKTLLLGVTGQSISLLSEVDNQREVEGERQAAPAPLMDTGRMPASFDGFLMQADQSPQRQSNETELLMNATTMRLQAMIARSEAQTNGHRS